MDVSLTRNLVRSVSAGELGVDVNDLDEALELERRGIRREDLQDALALSKHGVWPEAMCEALELLELGVPPENIPELLIQRAQFLPKEISRQRSTLEDLLPRGGERIAGWGHPILAAGRKPLPKVE